MISIKSATPVHGRTGRPATQRLFLTILLATVLAACQSTQSVLPDEEGLEDLEALAIIVSPSSVGSGDLDGETVAGTVVVSIPAQGWMREVRFFLDGERRHTVTSAPFEYTLDTTLLVDGPHLLAVEARLANGRVRVTENATFTVSNAGTPMDPGDPAPTDPAPSDPAPDPSDPEPDPTEPEPDPTDPEPEPTEPEPEPSEPEPAPTEPEPTPTEPEPTPTEPEPTPTEPEPTPRERVSPSLRGDPSFDAASLSGDAALWYQRLWLDIDHGSFDPIALAGRDDIYTYGRTLHTYVQSVLVVFRLTGDLALLDHVDEIAERMRAQLRDGWRGTLDGTDGTRDGYLNWVDRYEGGTHRGKDTMRINEIKTHALVAMMAYALEANRDLPSPGGRNYAAHADFWRNYLVNHFEAKWRERRGVPTAFPIMTRPGTHTYYSWIKWHYYMAKLTGRSAYMNEAKRMADNVWADLRPIGTATGTAYVWGGRVASAGGGSGSEILQATNYARYVFGDTVEFHLEGFHNWASTSQMQRFARTFTEFMIDRADPMRDGFAADVGGGVDRAGLISGDKDRMSRHRYRESSYPLIAAWDATGRVAELNAAAYASVGADGAAWLTAGSVLNASWSDGSQLAASRQP